MGDRSNVVFLDYNEDYGVAVYTHWCGSTLPGRVASALKASKPRWGDVSYFTRMCICDLLKKSPEGIDGEAGWGICPYHSAIGVQAEEEHTTIFIYSVSKKVKIGSNEWSFNEFIESFKKEGLI